MKIGLIDVDSHNFPNFALMRVAGYHRQRGDTVEWANPLRGGYDRVYQSKIFTFSQDVEEYDYGCEVYRGGTGYDVKSRLPDEIEQSAAMDYTIYPTHNFSVQFFSRGCVRNCPFCLVTEKEGYIHPVEPVQLNPKGEWIEVLDNNFFANPEWRDAVKWINASKQPVNLRGVDVRIMDEEQAYNLNSLRLVKNGKICVAWDLPQIDLTDRLRMLTRYIKPYKLMCYVLVGFNSTIEDDLHRLHTLRSLGITPHVQPYRDYTNSRTPSQYERDLQRWANRAWIFNSCEFKDFEPRKGFRCINYFNKQQPEE